jgi:hypothetical protein
MKAEALLMSMSAICNKSLARGALEKYNKRTLKSIQKLTNRLATKNLSNLLKKILSRCWGLKIL